MTSGNMYFLKFSITHDGNTLPLTSILIFDFEDIFSIIINLENLSKNIFNNIDLLKI
jgi:hypothetical protein